MERGEGDVISRLSVDSSIVGERCVTASSLQLKLSLTYDVSVTQNLSDGLRSIIMASVGRTSCMHGDPQNPKLT